MVGIPLDILQKKEQLTEDEKKIVQSHTTIGAQILDDIKGIGKNRKKILLETFDNIEDIKNASIDKLKSLGLPMDVITNLFNALNK